MNSMRAVPDTKAMQIPERQPSDLRPGPNGERRGFMKRQYDNAATT
jgi:hypothetical protein